MNETFEAIYRAVVGNVCSDYSYMTKLSPGTQFYIDGKATGQLQTLFTMALYMDVDLETLDEIHAL